MAAKKENPALVVYQVPSGRITRARAAANCANGVLLPSLPSLGKPDQKRASHRKSKRTALDENSNATSLTSGFQHKKRAVLSDVTNISSDHSHKPLIPIAKLQSKAASQRVKLVSGKDPQCSKKAPKLAPIIACGSSVISGAIGSKTVEQVHDSPVLEPKIASSSLVAEDLLPKNNREKVRESTATAVFLEQNSFRVHPGLLSDSKNGDFTALSIVDIDDDNDNPQMCSLYASEIYANLRAAELTRRPSFTFMETLQQDITQSMRGILIDWLVEVSEEYRLVPDTLYLTVHFIDRFLSLNYIERHRLQLLGITCMLIASKYEEICAPRVEEFCFITDNTYTKAEVLKMEGQILNYLGFHLSVPTVKTFLRRFLRAAQASRKAASLALGYLANYLAELTLVEYSFLKFLPSVIAASTVFLARWTLDQSDHPWNPMLEHYTSYKSSDLKQTVIQLQQLQLNNSCPLNAVREKYQQQKFESVSTLTSPEVLQSLFC